jgi:hypothetical protein
MPRPLVRVALAVTLGAVSAATGLAPASAAAAREVKASAKFTVELGDHSGSYDFGQSRITESQLDWTPQVPVSLHAGRRSGPFQEFALSGRVKKGSQRTSEAVALLLSVEVGAQSMLMNSTDGECTVRAKTLSKSRIAGSFTCDTTYGEQPLKAKGTFKAR